MHLNIHIRREKTSQEEETELTSFRDKITKRLLTFGIFCIAFIMIVYGLNSMYVTLFIDETKDDWLHALNIIIRYFGGPETEELDISPLIRLPGAILFVLAGATIIADPRKNFIRSVGLYAFAMGFSRMAVAYPMVASHVWFTTFIGWVVVILGANLMFSGYYMLSGTARGRTGMILTAAFMMIIYLEYFALIVYIETIVFPEENHLDPLKIARDYPTMSISCVMYAFLIWLVDTDEMRYGDKLTRHVHVLDTIDNTYRAKDMMSIEEEDALALLYPDSDRWKMLEDGGPAVKEMSFESVSKIGSTYVTVQKWKDSSKFYFTVSPSKDTMIYAERFSIDTIVPDYTEDGSFRQLYMLGGNSDVVRIDIRRSAR